MRTTFYIDAQQSLDLETIDELLQSSRKIDLSLETCQKISECRTYLDHKMKTNDRPIYGINTGFGVQKYFPTPPWLFLNSPMPKPKAAHENYLRI